MKIGKVQKVYFYEDENGRWITTSKDEAREKDKEFRLATIAEMEEFISLGCDVIKLIEVEEGVYYWIEIEYLTPLGSEEIFMQYIFLQHGSEVEIRDLARMINKMKSNT